MSSFKLKIRVILDKTKSAWIANISIFFVKREMAVL